MTTKNWIKKNLKENDYKVSKVISNYEDYLKDTGGKASKESFARMVRKIFKSIKEKEDLSKEYLKYNRDYLIDLISNEIENKKEKIVLRKFAENKNIPFGAFLKYVPDYEKVIKNIYQNQMYHIKDDIALNKLKTKLVFLEKENKFLKNKEMQKDLLLEVIKNAVSSYHPLDPPFIKKSKKTKRIAELLFSDAHFGDIIKKEQVIVNEYNPLIAKKRIDKLFNKTLEYCDMVQTKVLDINILGDMISGRIHQEILENTAFSTAEAIITLADYISQWILTVVQEGYIIDSIRCIPGNHGRMTVKPNFDNKAIDNFEWFLYEFIKRKVSNVVNHFIMPKSMIYIADIFETRFGILHGDIFKGGTGLNPVSGTWGRDTAKLNALFNSTGEGGFDIIAFGHFHVGDMLLSGFDKTKIIVNGSVKGTDSFSIGAVKTGARPNQTIFCIEEGKKGETSFFQTLFLDD